MGHSLVHLFTSRNSVSTKCLHLPYSISRTERFQYFRRNTGGKPGQSTENELHNLTAAYQRHSVLSSHRLMMSIIPKVPAGRAWRIQNSPGAQGASSGALRRAVYGVEKRKQYGVAILDGAATLGRRSHGAYDTHF